MGTVTQIIVFSNCLYVAIFVTLNTLSDNEVGASLVSIAQIGG